MRVNLSNLKWRKLLNPVDWLVWIYGKFFLSHPLRGWLVCVCVTVIFVSIFVSILWIRAVDKYNEEHLENKLVASQPTQNNPLPAPIKTQENISPIPTTQASRFPFIDIELVDVNEYSYDIYVHNKSSVALSRIIISRMVNPEKNKQKMAVQNETPKLRSLQKNISVLASGEKKKIHRENIPSWEYTVFIVFYWDDTDKQYRCVFEGDRSGLRLTDKSLIPKITTN
ncbi:MAG: hypothetical protein M1418_08890 [Deltaproteobacteria bacterium]|nr:hypothetical protein [Deltaproteobacteria bacterium]